MRNAGMTRGTWATLRLISGIGAAVIAGIGLAANRDHVWLVCAALCVPLVGLALWRGSGPGQSVFGRQTARLAHIVLTLFVILSLHLVHLQVVSADMIQTRTAVTDDGVVRNPRRLQANLTALRGEVFTADGTKIVGRTVAPDGTVGRTYLDPNLTYLVGYHNPVRFGDSGIELAYDDQLSGRQDEDPAKAFAASLLHQPARGSDLLLTVAGPVQAAATAALGNRRGSVVVLDAKTGAVVAMVSTPHIDPARLAPGQPDQSQAYWDQLRGDPASPFVFRPTQGLYTPGSTFKTVTASAALDTGKARPDTRYEDRGALNVEGYQLIEANIPKGRENQQSWTLTEGYEYSLNVVFAQVATRTLGGASLADYAGRFGFGTAVPFDLPTNASLLDSGPDFLNNAPAVAQTGFGQGQLLASPLQMAMIAATVANDGREMTPYLVSAVRRPDGGIATRTAPKVWRTPIRAETAAQMRTIMETSVASGYANTAAIPGVKSGGKTGTAEVTGAAPHAWYIGYAPGKNTTYAIAVLVENGGEGSTVAAPIAKTVLQATLAYDTKR